MEALFAAFKWFLFILNIICLFFGVGAIFVNAKSIEGAQPGTEAYTIFILAILLCSLLCLTTVIGCYGIFCEVFGIIVIYSMFILSLLIIQYLQIHSFQSQEFYFINLKNLESAWRLVELNPKPMDAFQTKFNCCGLFNAYDYSYKNLSIPDTCYASPTDDDRARKFVLNSQGINNVGCLDTVEKFYDKAIHRLALINWTLFITEFITFFHSIILSILILKRRFPVHRENLNRAVVQEFTQQNHMATRQNFLSN